MTLYLLWNTKEDILKKVLFTSFKVHTMKVNVILDNTDFKDDDFLGLNYNLNSLSEIHLINRENEGGYGRTTYIHVRVCVTQ